VPKHHKKGKSFKNSHLLLSASSQTNLAYRQILPKVKIISGQRINFLLMWNDLKWNHGGWVGGTMQVKLVGIKFLEIR
jgi:hypothetical protein